MGKMWRKLGGFSKYEISEFGDVRTAVKLRTRKKGHALKGNINQGYKIYKIVNDEGEKVKLSAHRLVALTFHGAPPSDKHVVAHYDGDKLNNHYRNLRWATYQENSDDMKRHKTTLIGSKNRKAKLTDEEVLEARRKYKGKYGDIQRLADEYGVSHTAMFQVVHRLNWRHLDG